MREKVVPREGQPNQPFHLTAALLRFGLKPKLTVGRRQVIGSVRPNRETSFELLRHIYWRSHLRDPSGCSDCEAGGLLGGWF